MRGGPLKAIASVSIGWTCNRCFIEVRLDESEPFGLSDYIFVIAFFYAEEVFYLDFSFVYRTLGKVQIFVSLHV